MMRIRDDVDVGVATHTGPVRGANEDDYLIFEPEDGEALAARGRIYILADGMGGVAGGAEASRTAVRTLAASYLAAGEVERAAAVDVSALDDTVVEGAAVDDGAASASTMVDVDAALLAGFDRASAEVHRMSRSAPQLAEMGTTLTALVLRGREAWIGHVGDCRCLRLRAGRGLEQLTQDHAVEEPRHLLTRCIGAGREREQVDQIRVDCADGDVFVLLSDGVWDVLEPMSIERLVRSANTARLAATALVDAAIEAGTTDNVTALVIKVLRSSAGDSAAALRDVDLPAGEALLPLHDQGRALTAPRWPWWLLVVGLALCALAIGKRTLGWNPLGL